MIKLCLLAILAGLASSFLTPFNQLNPGVIGGNLRVDERQLRPKHGKGQNDGSSGRFYGRTIINKVPGSSDTVKVHEFQHQPLTEKVISKTESGKKPGSVQGTRKARHVMEERDSMSVRERLRSAELPAETRLGLSGELHGIRQRRNLGAIGVSLMRLERIADNPPGAAEMRKAEMEQAAARAKAAEASKQTKPAPIHDDAPREEASPVTEDATEAMHNPTAAPENYYFKEPERQPVESLGLEPFAAYTEIPSYASRYRRGIASVGRVGLQFASKDKLTGGVKDVPSSLPVASLPVQGGVLDTYSGPLSKAESKMPLEQSFAPPADISGGGEIANNFHQPVPVANSLSGFEDFKAAPVPQDCAPGVKSGFDVLPAVPQSFAVAPDAADVQKVDKPFVQAPDSQLAGPPSAQGADAPSMKYEKYLAPAPAPEETFGFPVHQSGRLASSYSGHLPSSMPMSEGIDTGFKGSSIQGFGDEVKSIDETGRWKRSIGSIASVGMQFANKDKSISGPQAVASSLPVASLPVQGGVLDDYSGPLPKAESKMPLEQSFAPPADISRGGEIASSFQQPIPVANSLSGFEDFKAAPVPQDCAPGVKSGFDVLPAVPQSFAVAPGAADVKKVDKPFVQAPDSHLAGPPSAQGADVPSMKYENYLAPAPAPEDTFGFPVHQSGRLASSYSGHLPSSMPVGEGIDTGFKDTHGFGDEVKSVDGVGRWKRSISSVSSVGMQFASPDKLTGGIRALPSSLPVGSMPAHGGVLDIYSGPLPKAESQMPLEQSFAPPADISGGGEIASSFQQPLPVANALSGFEDFKAAPVPQDCAPGLKSGFDFLPAVPQSFAVAPGAADVQKVDRPFVQAPDSQLAGPPSAQGADVPSMKYEHYVPPAPAPEGTYGFPVHQSGRLASSYSGHLPSSMPSAGGIRDDHRAPSMFGESASCEHASSDSLLLARMK
uniref:Uncharacterized protein n=1 Tax=Trichuris muris TaxID=70415 RepID=A0A5S6QY93_TRIMR